MAYDIFISFKITGFNGEITEDVAIARELYNILNKRYKVFFSEEEIDRTGNSNFTQIIDKALDESQVLIFVCTNHEYLETSYVYHEWSSFHNVMLMKGKKREIFGLVKNVNREKIPFSLKDKQTYEYDSQLTGLITNVNKFFGVEMSDVESIELFNELQFKKYSEYSGNEYLRDSFNEFFEVVLKQKPSLSVISYTKNSEAITAMQIKTKTLIKEGEKFIYLERINEIFQIENKIQNEEFFVLINKVKTQEEMMLIYNYMDKYPNLFFIIGVKSDNIEVLSQIESEVLTYQYTILNETEAQKYLEEESSKLSVILTSKLLTIILMPSLKEFRTPKMLKIILMNIKQLENYLEYDYDIVDIFEIMDGYISRTDESLNDAMEELIQISMKKRIRKYTSKELTNIKEPVEKLIDLGFISKHNNFYTITSSEYYFYKIAEKYYFENGLDYSLEFLEKFRECIPYYVYLCYCNEEINIIDEFKLDTNEIFSVLQLFVTEEIFEDIVISGKYNKEVMRLLKHARRTGLYSIAWKIIKMLEENNVESNENFGYLSEKIYIHFIQTGEILETNETHGEIYYRKGYCYYCKDDYENAVKYFELAYQKTINTGIINYNLSFHYVELLLDIGDYDKALEILNIYDENPDVRYIAEYYFTKALIACDNLEFSLSIDYLNHCVEQCNKNVNIRKLQIYYGELGKVYYYLANYQEAKKYFSRNQYIARILDDYHGMAISSKMLGRINISTGNFEEAYLNLSYAETYAQKIGNLWRLVKIRILLDILLKTTDNTNELLQMINSIDSDVFKYDAYYLLSQLYYVCKKEEETIKYANMSYELAEKLNQKRALEAVSSWIKFINNQKYELSRNYTTCFDDLTKSLKQIKEMSINIDKYLDYYEYEEFITNRLNLRMIKISDAKDIFQYTSDFINTKYVLWKTHKNLNDTYQYINAVHSIENINDTMTWAICLKESNKVIGTVDLVYNETYKCVEIGYILNRKHWRKGYAEEAVRRIIEFSKINLKLKKLAGVTFKVNEPSNKFLQKLGFKLIKEIPNYHNRPDIEDKTGMYYELELE